MNCSECNMTPCTICELGFVHAKCTIRVFHFFVTNNDDDVVIEYALKSRWFASRYLPYFRKAMQIAHKDELLEKVDKLAVLV